jgi:hypothetical protein
VGVQVHGWKKNIRVDFDFDDAHDLNNLREWSSEDTIKKKLRERLRQSSLMIVLVGAKTKNLFRFVRWEMEIALDLGIPIVATYLNTERAVNFDFCPPIIRDELVLHIPYKQAAIRWAVENWETQFWDLHNQNAIGSRILTNDLLNSLGL